METVDVMVMVEVVVAAVVVVLVPLGSAGSIGSVADFVNGDCAGGVSVVSVCSAGTDISALIDY